MRAMVLRAHGDVEAIEFERDYPDPVAGPGEAVIRVKACTLNAHDLFTLKGMPGIRIPFPVIMGIDVAGEIASVGDGVDDWKPGDRVVIDPADRKLGKLVGETIDGGLAEYLKVPTHQLVSLPDDVDFETAAALPCAYGTAYRMMVTRGRIASGENVLILGASGGVGTCCVQLAKQAGATVIAAASSQDKLDRLRALGADEGIDYLSENFVERIHARFGKPRVWGDGGIEVVVNFTGGDTWVPSLRCLGKDGRMLTCGATAGFDPKEDLRFIWTFEQNIIGSNGWSREDLHALIAMTRDGSLKPVVEQRYALEDTHEAFRALRDRKAFGKLVVVP